MPTRTPKPLTQEEEVSLVTQIIPLFAAAVIVCALARYCMLRCWALVSGAVKEEEEVTPDPHEADELTEEAGGAGEAEHNEST